VVRCANTHGNTVVGVYTSATVNSMQAGNSHVLLNTAGIAVGMKLFYSNVAALNPNQDGGVYVTAVNSTVVTLTAAPTAPASNVELIFRTNIAYTAVAQEVVD